MSLCCISGFHIHFQPVICNSVLDLHCFIGKPVFSNFTLISYAGI